MTDAEIIAKAREVYATDDCEIDDEPAISHGDDGAFVAAWVWVAYPEVAACEQCGNTLNDGSDICDQCGGEFA